MSPGRGQVPPRGLSESREERHPDVVGRRPVESMARAVVAVRRLGDRPSGTGGVMTEVPQQPRNGDVRPCVFKACGGVMVFTTTAQLPGTGQVGKMFDGTMRTVGTTRAAWICNQDPGHIQTQGPSRSE